MPDTVTFTSKLTISLDGGVETLTLGTVGPQSRNLATISEGSSDIDTLSTSFQSISFGSVGDTERSWVCLQNLSNTTGEDITIGKSAVPFNGTDDGNQAGASVPATLTAAGHYLHITSDGTSQGIDWKYGDIAVYLGSSGSYMRIPATEFMLIRANDNCAFPPVQDGKPLLAKAETGTPRMSNIAAGALA